MCTIREKIGSKPGQKVTKLSLLAPEIGISWQKWKNNWLLQKMGVFLCNQPNRLLKTAAKPPKIPPAAPANRLFFEIAKNYYSNLCINLIFRRNFHFFRRLRRENCRPIAVAFSFLFVERRPFSPRNQRQQPATAHRRRVFLYTPAFFLYAAVGFSAADPPPARKSACFCLSGSGAGHGGTQ